jgi:hypothetical protein
MTRLSLRRDPVRLVFSPGLWAGAWYLFSYLFTGTAAFAVVVCAAVIAASLSFTLAGLPLLIAAAVVIRWCADVERSRLRIVCAEPVRGRYREAAGPAWRARLAARWSDSAVWHDLAYLSGLYAPLLALDSAVLSIWLTLLAGITAPAWYAKVSGASGFYIGTLPSALVLAGICLVLFPLFSYVVVATARLHAAVARALLGAHDDPLREAKEVLRRPGPLHTFIPN